MRSLFLACLLFATGAEAKVKIVATTSSLGALAREVGGSDVEVDVMAAPTEDPHFVDPKPSLILKLNQADMLILNGLELEIGWLPKLQVQARNPKVGTGGPGVLDASTLVDKLEVPATVDRSQGDIHPGGNPHFLYDPKRAAKIALGIAEKIASIDPSVAAGVRQRATTVAQHLDQVADQARANVQKLPEEKRRVVAYHKSLTYLEDTLGLNEIATVEPKPGVPPDPSHVANTLKTMKQMGTKVVLLEEFYPRSTPKTLADLSGGKLVVLEGGARFQNGDTYSAYAERLMKEVLNAL
jgi:zinc/manganese transport system substrate-binding protein